MLTKEQFFALVDLLDPKDVFVLDFDRKARGDKLTVRYVTKEAKKTRDVIFYWSPLRRWVTELRRK